MKHVRALRARPGRLGAAAGTVSLVTMAGLIALAGCGSQISGAAASPGARGHLTSGDASGRYGTKGLASSAAASAQDSPSGVSGGALFGGNLPLVSLEANLGRKLAIVRLYYFIGNAFPGGKKFGQLLAGGRTLLVSLDSNGASYASIAAGNHDAAISAFLKSVNQAAVRYHLGAIYICFEHEPDNNAHHTLGSPAQFIQAWDHVHRLAESAHLDWNDGGRLHWVFILIHTSFENWRATSFWPGPGEVDIVAADGYNSVGCGRIQRGSQQSTPASLFGPMVSFAAAHGGLPTFASEWGSDDIPSGVQSTFINEMQTYVAGHPQIAGALYWNTHKPGGTCNYTINGNPAAISAMAAMGQSAALQGHVGK